MGARLSRSSWWALALSVTTTVGACTNDFDALFGTSADASAGSGGIGTVGGAAGWANGGTAGSGGLAGASGGGGNGGNAGSGATGGMGATGGAADTSLDSPTASNTYADEVKLDQPLAYWRLSTSSGGTTPSAVGAYAASLTGSPALVAGIFSDDGAMQFDGLDLASLADKPEFEFQSNAPFTIEAWVKFTGPTVCEDGSPPSGDFRIVTKYRSANPIQSGWTFRINGCPLGSRTLVFHMQVMTDAGINDAYVSKPLPDQTKFHHCVVTYSPGLLTLWLDGQSVDTDAKTVVFTGDDRPLTFGNHSNGTQPLMGVLDELAIYPKALSAARIQAHYAAGSAEL